MPLVDPLTFVENMPPHAKIDAWRMMGSARSRYDSDEVAILMTWCHRFAGYRRAMLLCPPTALAVIAALALSAAGCAHGAPPPSTQVAATSNEGSTPTVARSNEPTESGPDGSVWRAAIEAYDQATEMPFATMITTQGRYIGVGYVLTDAGVLERQLIVVEYAYANNFHASVNGQNYLCAFIVSPQRDTEAQQTRDAIAALERGEVPADNPAYRWASRYELPDETHCEEAARDDQGTLATWNAQWRLRRSGRGVVLRAEPWGRTEDIHGSMIVHTAVALRD
jgi:hypothetical protein